MERTLDLCRWTYNQTLAYRKDAWEKEGKSVSKYETHNLLPTWKEEKPELNDVFSQTLQNAQERVDLALKAFFRRVKAGENPGYPRFRGRGWYDSFTYPQKDGSLVGVDVGLESFATLSNGETIANPRFFREEETELARVQRKLSKAPKGTPERKKALRMVERVHERIANKRYDFAHKVSRYLVNRFGLIAFEDLSIQNMLKNHCLAKSISDVAWNMLVTLTSYKAASAGSVVILVDPRNTSKMCSRCGILVEKTLSDRVHNCPHCGLSVDRDWNAAINILRLGLQSVGIKTVEACPF